MIQSHPRPDAAPSVPISADMFDTPCIPGYLRKIKAAYGSLFCCLTVLECRSQVGGAPASSSGCRVFMGCRARVKPLTATPWKFHDSPVCPADPVDRVFRSGPDQPGINQTCCSLPPLCPPVHKPSWKSCALSSGWQKAGLLSRRCGEGQRPRLLASRSHTLKTPTPLHASHTPLF